MDSRLWEDHDGNSSYLIKSCEDFIVYLDKVGDVDWETAKKYDETLDDAAVGMISNRSALLKALPTSYLSQTARHSFNVMLGEATARILEGEPKAAHAMLDEAQQFVLARIRELARGWYLAGSALAAVVAIALAWPVVALVNEVHPLSDLTRQHLVIAASAGACGALVSVLLRSRTMAFNAAAGVRVHYVDGASRIFVGAFGGILLLLAMLARMVMPDARSTAVVALVGIAAGFSERLVPTLIERIEVALLDADGQLGNTPSTSYVAARSKRQASAPRGTGSKDLSPSPAPSKNESSEPIRGK
jgi:hypothetical protein